MKSKVHVTTSERGGRTFASSGSAWEPVVGYSRAVRAGAFISVSGTLGVEADGSYDPTVAGQTRRALTIILAAIEALGGSASDVVRTRIYVTDVTRWEEAGKAHGEFFGEIRPATTLVQSPRLVAADALVEVEADAIVGH